MKRYRRMTLGALIVGGLVVVATMLAEAQERVEKGTTEPSGHETTTTGSVVGLDHTDMKNTRVRFEPGARTHWHSHAGGQVLVVQEGRGRMQEEDGPIREMAPGDAIFTRPGVAHWHGAAPDQHVVLLSFYIGTVTWKQPVTAAEYQGSRQK